MDEEKKQLLKTLESAMTESRDVYIDDFDYYLRILLENCSISSTSQINEYTSTLLEYWIVFCNDSGGSTAEIAASLAKNKMKYNLQIKNNKILKELSEAIEKYALQPDRIKQKLKDVGIDLEDI